MKGFNMNSRRKFRVLNDGHILQVSIVPILGEWNAASFKDGKHVGTIRISNGTQYDTFMDALQIKRFIEC